MRLRAGFARAWNAALDRLAASEDTLMLRDFHSPNIIWRGERSGHDRLGIIDFQDALIGPSAYDVASLAMDARVTVPPEIEKQTRRAYVAARHAAGAFDEEAFGEAYAIMAAQRNSKILGIFVRLERARRQAGLSEAPAAHPRISAAGAGASGACRIARLLCSAMACWRNDAL